MTRSGRIQAMINRDFPPETHPYRIFEQTILSHLEPGATVLDIGCGSTAPNLIRLKGRAKTLIGLDIVDFETTDPDLTLISGSVCHMSGIASNSIDLAYSRSVMEHIKDVGYAYAEISRVLRPGGKYIFLTPNFWDYASLIAYLVPNRLHATIVRWTEGRLEHDTFPTFYRSNTYRRIEGLASESNLFVANMDYLGQYPSYFMFSENLIRLAARYERFSSATP